MDGVGMDGVLVSVGSVEASPRAPQAAPPDMLQQAFHDAHALQSQLREARQALRDLQDQRAAERQTLAEHLRELASHPATAGTTTALEALADTLAADEQLLPDELEDELGRLLAARCEGRLQYRARMTVRPEHLTPRIARGLREFVREAVECIATMKVEQIGLKLENDHRALLLRITDDGVSPASAPAERAPCIAALQHWASQLGGTLFVTYGRRGTALQLRLQLRRAPPAAF